MTHALNIKKTLEQLLTFVPVGVVMVGVHGTVLLWNKKAEEIFKKKADTVVGKPFLSFFPRSQRKTITSLIDSSAKSKNVSSCIVKLNNRNQRSIEITVSPVHNNTLEAGILLIIRDVTDWLAADAERETFEQMLLESNDILQSVIEGISDPVFVKDTKGNYLFINSTAAKVLNKKPKEMLGKNTKEVFDKINSKRILETDARVLKTKQPITYEEHLILGEEEIYLHTTKGIYKNYKGKILGILGISRDITQQKRQEQTQEFLSQASKILASSLNYQKTLESIANLAVPTLADWCVIDMFNRKGEIEHITIAHKDAAKVRLAYEYQKKYPTNTNDPTGVAAVMRTGKTEYVPIITKEMIISSIQDKEKLKILEKIGFTSYICIPLVMRNKILGAISFISSTSGRHFSKKDVELFTDLTSRAALAVDNALLYSAERQARLQAEKSFDRIARLQAITAALSKAIYLHDMATVIIEKGFPALNTSAGTVFLYNSSSRTIEILKSFGYSAKVIKKWKTFPLDRQTAISEAIKTGRPVFLFDKKEIQKKFPSIPSEVRRHNTLVRLPLTVKGTVIGGISLNFAEKKEFTDEDLKFLFALADQCAQAVERAQLYETAEKARVKVESELHVRLEAEEKLQQLAAIVESSDDAIIGKSLEGEIISWNPGAEKMYGYKANEVLGKSIKIIMPFHNSKELKKILNTIKQGKSIDHYEAIRMRKDKTRIVTSVSISPVFSPEGKIVSAAVIARDITEHKKMEDTLRKSRDQLEIVFQGVADGITVQDPHGKIIYANDAAAEQIGYSSAEELLRTPVRNIMSNFEMLDEFDQPFPLERLPGRRSILGEKDARETIQFIDRRNGEKRWSTVSARPVFDQKGKVLFAINIFHDITQRKELDRRKDDFISIASHELKTPVTSVKAFTQVLQKRFEKEDNPEISHYLFRIDTQVNKLANLISGLLDVSKIQSGKIEFKHEQLNIDELLHETIEDFQHTTDSHRVIIGGESHAIIQGDKDRLSQVFINLLSNAVKYSPNAEKVVVKIYANKSNVTIGIQDFGIGISSDHHEKIFERFYRVKGISQETFSGLGVGLYISSEIITRHNGTIWVESTHKFGSTFYVQLPAVYNSSALALPH